MRTLELAIALTLGLFSAGCFVNVSPCSDGYLNGSESDVDCGGSCAACNVGRRCFGGADCTTGLCVGGICSQQVATSCSDGIRNGSESDVDCGGSCVLCTDGRQCLAGSDCASGLCSSAGRCTTASIPNFSSADVWQIDIAGGVLLQPGVQAGFGITANTGSSFRLVWTGDAGTSASYHNFYGSVYTAGSFTSVTPGCAGNTCPLESGDYVSSAYNIAGGQELDFDTIATTGIDGFDFVVDTEPVYFDLYIDGVRYPNLVYFSSGGAQAAPTSEPFGLKSH